MTIPMVNCPCITNSTPRNRMTISLITLTIDGIRPRYASVLVKRICWVLTLA